MADAAVTIIGGGVVGLAIAAELSAHYSPLFLLERHPRYGTETSSRNSEVIHAGIYYLHGSLKAELCVEGRDMLYSFCEKHGIPFRRITKIITATRKEYLPDLERLYQHGTGNGVPLEMMTAEQVHALEPHIASAGGILSPTTGIISAHRLMDFFYHSAKKNGAEILTHCEVVGLKKESADFNVTIDESGNRSTFTSEIVINAAGLESDTVAAMAGIDVDAAGYRLHHCKGSYFAVSNSKRNLISRLVYPTPTTESLGVHALIDLGGRLKFGPDVEYLSERTYDYSVDGGKRHAFAESVRAILPSIKDEDLSPDYSGIRAKLQAKGEPVRDYIIRHESDRGLSGLINLIGIESPGLTASPAIARYVHDLLRS
ncbi:MAG: NAD(P)/FAD-dependent oxidoreductase [Bacteroidetes bacterium]|nr:NAD(P)/FAD-dependent oxidoreductase [Bacteroidota bacterium]MCW5895303.1 NAD(P)/FAD-dependent oxidoreductase [Bacteroidota bacterium]